jgi:hypothetical protein
MLSTTTVFRNASRKACNSIISERVGYLKTSRLLAPSSKKMFTTTMRKCRTQNSLTESSSFQARFPIPEPLPALALAYDYEDSWDDADSDSLSSQGSSSSSSTAFPRKDFSTAQQAVNSQFRRDVTYRTSATTGRGPSSSSSNSNTPYSPPLSSAETSKGIHSRKSGGGGSGGRHRCPKCGTHVTFRHDDFEANTFYCATCSGWFVANPNTISGTTDGDKVDDSPYDEFLAKNGETRKPEDPLILMHHVSRNGSPFSRVGNNNNLMFFSFDS